MQQVLSVFLYGASAKKFQFFVSHAPFFFLKKKINSHLTLNYFHLRVNNDITAQTSTFLNRIFIKNKVRKEVWQVLEVVLI